MINKYASCNYLIWKKNYPNHTLSCFSFAPHQEIFLPEGPLLPEKYDVAMIPQRLRRELTINLSGETKHFVSTYYFIELFVK